MPVIEAVQDDIWDVVKLMKENELVDDTPPVIPPELEVTPQEVRDVVALLKDPEANGGYGGIASTVGVERAVVRMIDEAKRRRLDELSASAHQLPIGP